MTTSDSPRADATKVQLETAREIVRLSELYLDGTIRFSIAADSRATSLSGTLAAASTALIAAGLTLLFAKEPMMPINAILGVAALASSCCFVIGLWNAAMAARPRPFNVAGNHLSAWTNDDLHGDLAAALIGQAAIYDEQISENRNRLRINARRIERALGCIKYAAIVALSAGLLTYGIIFPPPGQPNHSLLRPQKGGAIMPTKPEPPIQAPPLEQPRPQP